MCIKEMQLIAYLIIAIPLSALSQNNTVSAGGGFANNEATIQFSIGQIFADYHQDESYSIAEGMIQYTIEDLTAIPLTGLDDSTPEITVFPNPASDFFTISSKEIREPIHFQMIDAYGSILFEGAITNQSKGISIPETNDRYFILKVYSNEKIIKHFKIIKQ